MEKRGKGYAPEHEDWWAPPGSQPGGLYVGTEAHAAIANSYRVAHLGDRMFLNHSPMSTILQAFETMTRRKANREALSEDERARRPDIANLSRQHLYEINLPPRRRRRPPRLGCT
jgi:hypothetical protein